MHHRKTLSNKNLSLIAGTVLALFGFVFSTVLLRTSNSREQWVKLENSALSTTLSGQTENLGHSGNPKGVDIVIPILMYHHVDTLPADINEKTDPVRVDLTVSPEDFEIQTAWLKGQGFNSISLNDLYNYSLGKFTMPKNPVIFTFDDGYEDVFINAVPILKKYGFMGSFGIITQFPGIKYGTNTYATWDLIKNAQRQGMEIVSHTQDHFDGTNPRYGQDFILKNLLGSRQDIKDNLGNEALPILIYPFGHYNDQYIHLADQAGFKIALTTNDGKLIEMDKLMEIPRVRIHGKQDFEKFKELILK